MTIESVIARAVADEVGRRSKRRRGYGKGTIIPPRRPGGGWSYRVSDGKGGRDQVGPFPTRELVELALEARLRKQEFTGPKAKLYADLPPMIRRYDGVKPFGKLTLKQLHAHRKTLKPRRGLSQSHKRAHIKRAKGCCETCGFKPHPIYSERVLHIHHVFPHVRGGTDDPGNLVTICANCHSLSHAIWGNGKKGRWDGPTSRDEFLRDLPARAADGGTPKDPGPK